MNKRGWDHELMSTFQRKEYAKLRAAGIKADMRKEIEITVEAMKAGGASLTEARFIAGLGLRDLRNQGINWSDWLNGWK
jgi:hypothetical protein